MENGEEEEGKRKGRTEGDKREGLSNISLLLYSSFVRFVSLARCSASITDGVRAVMVYTGQSGGLTSL